MFNGQNYLGFQMNDFTAIFHGGSISPLHNRTFKPVEPSGFSNIAVRKFMSTLNPLVCWSIFLAMEETASYIGYWLCYKLNYLGKHSNLVGSCLPAGIEIEHSMGHNIILSDQLLLDYGAHGKMMLWVWPLVCTHFVKQSVPLSEMMFKWEVMGMDETSGKSPVNRAWNIFAWNVFPPRGKKISAFSMTENFLYNNDSYLFFSVEQTPR